MPLPDTVRAAVQNADAEWTSMYGDEPAKVVNAPDPLAAFAGQEDVKSDEPKPTEAAAQGEPAQTDPSPEPTPAPEAKPQSAPQPDPWEQRYKVLKGKYDSEVPLLQQQLRQALSSIEGLQSQVQQLQSKPAEPEKTEPAKLELTPEERTAFGDDLLEVTRKIAAAEAAREAARLRDQLQKTEATVQTVTRTADEVAYERFLTKVTDAVPDWESVNERQDWLEWLGQYDPLLGSQRQAALDAATRSRDASRVAAIFNAFKGTLGSAPVADTQPPAQQVANHVAPRSQPATPTQPTQAKRLYTEADIAQLFSANRRGEFTREQWATISAEIDAAVSEGRVR